MCNEIHYEFTGQPAVTALCHCTVSESFQECSGDHADYFKDCQKWSGSAFTSNAVVPRKDFKLTKGTAKSYAIVGDSGKNVHWFCPTCGSSLYTELGVMPDMTCVKSGSIDKVGVEFYVCCPRRFSLRHN